MINTIYLQGDISFYVHILATPRHFANWILEYAITVDHFDKLK